MEKSRLININLIVVLIIALGHTFIHYSVFSSGVENQKGISGFSVTNVEKDNAGTFSLSLLIIGFEWATLMFIAVFTFTRERVNSKKEEKELKIDKERMKRLAETGTEIDMLYEIVKTNHNVKISKVEKLFGVDKEKVMSWGKTLSEAKLAYINYPSMGEPEIVSE